MLNPGSIGIFDSGYGGLTVLSEIESLLPMYDYCYLGDNFRAPYGSRSFEEVYDFTLIAVKSLFAMGCNLVILACNTASAKALRTIQQNDLPVIDINKRVLGIIRPTAEIIGGLTMSRHVGVLGTEGTIKSDSYRLEINKLYPDIVVTGESCPMWASLVENNKYDSDGADYFIQENLLSILAKDPLIDSLILACTHYPLLLDKIQKYLPPAVKAISQGGYIAHSLQDYLRRHSDIEIVCTKNGITTYLTTGSVSSFEEAATIFLNKKIKASHISLK